MVRKGGRLSMSAVLGAIGSSFFWSGAMSALKIALLTSEMCKYKRPSYSLCCPPHQIRDMVDV
jgi:hypothetical protein